MVIPPERASDFIAGLPVGRLWGVGPRTAARLIEIGYHTAGELRAADTLQLERLFGSFGRFLHGLARGEDPRPVSPHRAAKSRGAETTLTHDLLDRGVLERLVVEQCEEVALSLRKLRRPARTVTIKVRYSDFVTITRSRTLAALTVDATVIADAAVQLLRLTEAGLRPVRLVGVQASSLYDPLAPEQLPLPLGS